MGSSVFCYRSHYKEYPYKYILVCWYSFWWIISSGIDGLDDMSEISGLYCQSVLQKVFTNFIFTSSIWEYPFPHSLGIVKYSLSLKSLFNRVVIKGNETKEIALKRKLVLFRIVSLSLEVVPVIYNSYACLIHGHVCVYICVCTRPYICMYKFVHTHMCNSYV